MRIIRYLIITGISALITGIIINQIHPRGIRFHQLLLVFPVSYSVEAQTMTSDSALVLMFEETAIFLDIRSHEQYTIDHIPTALSIPFGSLNELNQIHLDVKKPWIIYDFHDQTRPAKYVYKRLNKKLIPEVYLLEGGYAEWLNKQYPTELGDRLKGYDF